MTEKTWHKSNELVKFSPNTWIAYTDSLRTGICFVKRIRDIPENHIAVRFHLLSDTEVQFLDAIEQECEKTNE